MDFRDRGFCLLIEMNQELPCLLVENHYTRYWRVCQLLKYDPHPALPPLSIDS